ncbi:ABC transporter permease [Paenibacillus sp. YN15]|uniref:ABC transporter permease n=1 Tax=Paenibacillus sp. YN15 TaxID=1742774 RepID=UPI000DCC7186|nr:anibiotic ABC transporter [Paenibacillus sp. YN15]RAV05044.1 anibiotic ABC transporter [Paenibacillus sp. YN15]
MKSNLFAGTAPLVRLALRRDRIKLAVWLVGLTALLFSLAATYDGFFASEQEMIDMVAVRTSSPVMRLFDPPVSGASLGGFTMLEMYTFIAVLVALMAAQTVVRHTRQNEETGRSEMIGSASVGRFAGLAAGLIVAAGASLALVPLFALALTVNGLPAEGSFAAAAAFGGIGLAFAGLAALMSQLSETSRGANSLAAAGLGLSFLLSATGNMLGKATENGLRVESAWPAWLSPLGWGGQMRAFHDNNWWTLALFAAAFVVLSALALWFASARDLGAGLLPARKGSPTAHPALAKPFGLAWRLQRSSWIGWAVGTAVFGAVFGGISNELEDMLRENEKVMGLLEQLGGTAGLLDTFFAMAMGIMGCVLAVYLVSAMLRMRSEEERGTLEPVLGTAMSRYRWKLGYMACAVTGALGLLLLLGLVTGLTAFLVTGKGVHLYELPVAALLQAPPVLILGGIASFAFGLAPRLSQIIAWAGLGASLLAGPMVAELLQLPQWAKNISPFTHVAAYPAEDVTAGPLLWMLAVAVVLTAAGLLAFRRRSLSL